MSDATPAVPLTPPARSVDPRASVAAARALGVPRDYAETHRLKRVREPGDLEFVGHDVHGRPQWLAPRAARAFVAMRMAAYDDGIALDLVSAFRSIEYQLGILRRKIERGLDIADILRVSAAPGYSEHHSGRAVDLTSPGFEPLEETFDASPAFAWLTRRAAAFGFVLSYPRDNSHRIAYEPWHWCWHPKAAPKR